MTSQWISRLFAGSWLLLLASSHAFPSRIDKGIFGLRAGSIQSTYSKDAAAELDAPPEADKNLKLPNPTSFGYLGINSAKGSAMYHMFYEAQEAPKGDVATPIVLWLQGGPGCSSFFGMLYINGPYFVNELNAEGHHTLRRNLGTWNRIYGMLFIEQPIAVGFSPAGTAKIPDNELDVGWDLYRAIQSFYRMHPDYQDRPLIVTGESYAGKYAPSIAHFILQADARANGYESKLRHGRELSKNVEAPLFKLGGLAVGNGFTDAETQIAVQAEVAWGMGLIDGEQRRQAELIQVEVIDLSSTALGMARAPGSWPGARGSVLATLERYANTAHAQPPPPFAPLAGQVRARQWRAARNRSDDLMAYITQCSGSATLEDVRRNTGYDSRNLADAYLNQHHVRAALGVPPLADMEWASCSALVDRVMGHDVMKSVKNLVEDLIHFHPVLIYLGQWDAECGVGSNDAWIWSMNWGGYPGFRQAPRRLWSVNDRIAGYWRSYSYLDVLVLRNVGHMVPHDNPLIGQLMLEKWVETAVRNRTYTRDQTVTPAMEEQYSNPDVADRST